MKRKIFALLSWLTIISSFSLPVSAQQQPTFGNYFRFDFTATSKYGMVKGAESFLANDTAVYQALDYQNTGIDNQKIDIKAKSSALLGVKLNPKLTDFWSTDLKSVSKSFTTYYINDSSAAVVIALGVTKGNYHNYRYHVVMNDSLELVKWSEIPAMEQKYGAKQPYGFIGNFKYPGKQVLVEVVNVKNYNDRDGIVFNWQVNVIPHINEIQVDPSYGMTFNLGYPKINHGYATRFNPVTGMPLDARFPADSVFKMRITFAKHVATPYWLYLVKNISGKKDSLLLVPDLLDDFYDLEKRNFAQPGKYEIVIHPAFTKFNQAQELHFQFEVLPPPATDKKVSLKQILPYIIATLTGVALLFGGYYRRNQVKLLKAAQEKQTAGLKLRSIRAQLNPHFMFNALTSIQNLVNKNDIAGANHYLSKFAGLTRQVLDTSNEELLSLEQEISILDDYLQMEQLRFNFTYQITVDEALNRANTEIPAMLLQPFVENAVKHGVAALRGQGIIQVSVIREGQDIIFGIRDNGNWSQSNITGDISGYGLKLSQERVALLNQLHKDQPVSLHIDKHASGTMVSIRLTNWI